MRAVHASAQATGGPHPSSAHTTQKTKRPATPLPPRAAAASSAAASTLTERDPSKREARRVGGVGAVTGEQQASNIVALPGRGVLPSSPTTTLRRRFLPITPSTPVLSGGGGGLFFFWQLGAIDFISRHYDLSRVAFRGASAGGLVVTLAACGVPAERALAAAHELALAHDLFDRPLGAAGVFGRVVRDWLHDLLPADAVDRCRGGRLKLVVTPLRPLSLFAPATVDCFTTKEELVDACLASAHVPFFLDGRPSASYRGRAYMDGSFQDFFTRGNSEALACGGGAYVLDYLHDTELETGRLDFLKLRDLDGARGLMATGAAYARRQMESGALDRHFSGVRLAGTDGLTGLSAPAAAGL